MSHAKLELSKVATPAAGELFVTFQAEIAFLSSTLTLLQHFPPSCIKSLKNRRFEAERSAMIAYSAGRVDVSKFLSGEAIVKQFEEDRINVSLWTILAVIIIYDQCAFLFI